MSATSAAAKAQARKAARRLELAVDSEVVAKPVHQESASETDEDNSDLEAEPIPALPLVLPPPAIAPPPGVAVQPHEEAFLLIDPPPAPDAPLVDPDHLVWSNMKRMYREFVVEWLRAKPYVKNGEQKNHTSQLSTVSLTFLQYLPISPYLLTPAQLRSFACALSVFHVSGIEDARTRFPLQDWALFRNSHNRRRAIALLCDLDEIHSFRVPNESIDVFFRTFNYGSTAMTMRGNFNKFGEWADGDEVTTPVVSGIHTKIKEHFTKCGFIWRPVATA